MKLVDLKITEFVAECASDSPAPGGGSVSALAASVGSALTMMVCRLTIGKKKYAEYDEEVKAVLKDMERVNSELVAIIDKDTEAFNDVSAVFTMPKETEADKEKRREAMQLALQGATKVPFTMMELMLEGLKITKRALGKTNTNAASDLGVAALNLKSGIQGAWLNVLINISGIKDVDFVNEYRGNGEKLLAEGCRLADEIYEEILKVV